MNTTRIESIPLNHIRHSPYNPETRVQEYEKLKAEIVEHGQMIPVVAVEFPNGVYVIADGNRRFAVAQELGAETLHVLPQRPVAGQTADELLDTLFVLLNKGTKPFNGRDKLNVALQGGPTFDANIKSAKLQLEALFPSHTERAMLVNKEITTTVLNIAKRSTKYVLAGSGIGEDTPTFKNRLANHTRYLLRNNAQQAVTSYMRLGLDRELLKKAIDNNRPPARTSTPQLIAGWNK